MRWDLAGHGYGSSLITFQCVRVCNSIHLISQAAQRIRKSTLLNGSMLKLVMFKCVCVCLKSPERREEWEFMATHSNAGGKNIKLACHNKFWHSKSLINIIFFNSKVDEFAAQSRMSSNGRMLVGKM